MSEIDDIALARSAANADQMRKEYRASLGSKNLILILIPLVVVVLIALAPKGGSSNSSHSDVQYKVAAKETVRRRLRDPASAEFSGLEVHRMPGRSVVICGLVSSRNGFGGMTGAQRFISGDQVIIEEGMPPGRMDAEWASSC